MGKGGLEGFIANLKVVDFICLSEHWFNSKEIMLAFPEGWISLCQ